MEQRSRTSPDLSLTCRAPFAVSWLDVYDHEIEDDTAVGVGEEGEVGYLFSPVFLGKGASLRV